MRKPNVPSHVSTLAIAIALVAGASPAHAQLVGTIDSSAGIDTVNSTNSNLIITGDQAVINWTATNNPSGGQIVFLPDANGVTFSSGNDFAVLNRVTPGTAGNAIYMGGSISSFAGDFTGGTVFFYSPNGIVIGQNASINVGSLGLTTLPISDDGQGNWMTGFGTASPQVTFGQATDVNSFIRTEAMIDGSINAHRSPVSPGSYVALVAPIVQHSGIIRTDTAAALVAAEAATITFSPDGLFNIQVTVGTDAATGIDVNGGTIERRDLTEGLGNHYAYLVAVAKNDAVDMLIRGGGDIGFDTATSATVEDNVVILSGGRDISSGQTDTAVGGRVDLQIDAATFTTDVEADLSGGADIRSDNGNTSFGLDPTSTSLNLLAGADSSIAATGGNTLSIAGDLFASLDKVGTTLSPTGNTLSLTASGSGSSLSVGGDALLTTRVNGAGEQESGIDAADVTGGTVTVQNGSGSTIDIAGSLDINVDATGGSVAGGGAAAGSATGGTAQILANGGSGNGLTVTGPVNVSASGTGGSVGSDCLADCGVTGGNGTGGTILVQASTTSGSQLNLGSTVDLAAHGQGEAGDVAAGSGTGGTVRLVSSEAGSIIIADDLTAEANGEGGFGMESSAGGGNGGNATGGLVTITFAGAASSIDLQGTAQFNADAFGGDGWAAGGNATGGFVNLQTSSNGTLTANFVGASADASGGSSDISDTGSGIAGGTATGGRAWVQSIGGGSAQITDLSLSANAFGGQSESGAGGAGTGGYVIASADSASLTVSTSTDLEALGSGGLTSDEAGVGGLGTGGQADIFSENGGTATLTGFVSVDTTGRGGNYFSDGSTGGNGTGGTIFFQANDGGTLVTNGEVQLTADGIGGFSFGDCISCGGTGGDGTGGTVTIQAFGGATTTLTVNGEVNASAAGFGSSGFAGPGGDGQGGTVRLGIHSGATANLLGNLFLNASGNGGWQGNGGTAGNGTGGLIDAFVNTSGGTLNVDGFAEFSAIGFGGTTDGINGSAGDGIGGVARFLGLGGTANFASDLIVRGEGYGGSAGSESFSGTGGDGTGRTARISAAGGDINIAGTASVSANGFGGSGTTGGNGTGGGDYFGGMIDGAHLYAQNGGDLVVGGMAVAMSDGVGADGSIGGNGGNGTGGWASIHAANGNAGPGSISVQAIEAAAFVSANGIGGNGGSGTAGADGPGGAIGGNGATGGAGGNGGTGTGGVAAITAAAGNGTLNIDFGFVDANGIGGAGGSGGIGGTGGFGSNGPGGNGGAGGVGGAGGAAFGGLASAGVESGTAQAAGSNLGTANLAQVEITANGLGGDGGAGGAGGAAGPGTPGGTAGASGNGGDGGNAVGGIAELQVRGGTANVGSAVLTSAAVGGDGGSGAVLGNGGDAESDEAYVIVTNRAGNAALRGMLDAGSIIGSVTSTGGAGLNPGTSLMEGGSGFVAINGDAVIGSFDLSVTADGQIADLATDPIILINSDVDVAAGFSLVTDGVASILADNSTLNAGTFTVSASNFVHEPDFPSPASVGVIGADTINLTTGQDLIVDAHLISTNSLNLFAPGLIDIEDATSGGDLTLQAGSTIDGGTQTAAGSVLANAPGNITLGNVVAGDLIDILSTDGGISLGLLSAASSIDLEAAGNIGFGDVTADAFDFSAGGDVNGGDILAGTQATGEAGGAVTLGDIDVGVLMTGGAAEDGFAVGIAAEGPITVGNVVADESIGFATLGNLTTGSLDAGVNVMTLVGGNTTIASIAAPGRTYHGDAQMFLDAGGPDNFDPNHPSFAGNPVRSGGSYSVTGAISTGQLQVGAASIGTGNITAFDSAWLDAAGSVTTGNIDTNLLNITAGTDIGTGDIFAFDGVDMDAGGSILTGDIDAGSIDLLAGNDIGTGYLNTQLIFQLGGGFTTLLFPGASITLESGGDISTGDISSIDGVYLNAGGGISTGTIDAFDFVEAHAGGDIGTDDIDAGSYVLLDAGGALTTAAINAGDISATAGGTAAIGGAWTSGTDVRVTSNDIDITANGSVSGGDISLVSTNAMQTVVGDGVTGGGYQLSDAEYDRLHANDITVLADTALGAAPRMLIGDLSVDGSDGEGINDYEFITGDGESETAEGSIRILGDMVFSNMGGSSVGFTTGTFELDAATGLLSLEDAPGVLGGELFLIAAHIHAASGDILDQLAEDPQYDGYQQDLNSPAEAQRPEGVIRANIIEIEFGDAGQGQLNTLYVQNTGTSDTPAGFVIGGASLFGEGNEVTPPPGSIDIAINGQIVTEGGTLTGIDVRDALVEAEGDLTPFTANSTINGCLLTGACIDVPPTGPFPPGFTPLPGLPEEFELVDNGQLPPPPFGNEDFIDDNIETTIDGATSPITPPQPLFDTSALGDKGDIDDPVSGSGNPALMETGPASACRADGSQAPGTCKQEKQP